MRYLLFGIMFAPFFVGSQNLTNLIVLRKFTKKQRLVWLYRKCNLGRSATVASSRGQEAARGHILLPIWMDRTMYVGSITFLRNKSGQWAKIWKKVQFWEAILFAF